MPAPGCLVHTAVQLQFFHNVHHHFRLFTVIYVHKYGVISQNSPKTVTVLHFFIGLEVFPAFQFFNALFTFGFNITFVKHLPSPTLCNNFQYLPEKFPFFLHPVELLDA